MEKKRAIDITLNKEGMDIYLKIKTLPEIEKFFKTAAEREARRSSDAIEVSSKWFNEDGDGLEFYKKSEKLTGKVESYGDVMDHFGNGLMDDNGKINLAPLRLVGISEGEGVTMKTDDLLGYEETLTYINRLADWTVQFYQNHLRNYSLSAGITLESEN